MSAPQRFPGTIAIVAPHQDDETLGCGGLIALLSAHREIHVVFATDGSRSPTPDGLPDPALVARREEEARHALGGLGVPPEHLHFLRLPDGRLSACEADLDRALRETMVRIAPVTILVPFRFDWHRDHVAVHRTMARAHAEGGVPGTLVEYFVYTQRRLLPGNDIRACLAAGSVWAVDITPVADLKRQALECYRSQTTKCLAWQRRPILTSDVLTRACASPEVFLPSVATLPTRAGVPSWWIGVASRWEPRLKRTKDAVVSWLPN